MRPLASDLNGGGTERLDRLAPDEPLPGLWHVHLARLRRRPAVEWGPLSWTAETPAGTGITLIVRTGNTPTPDGSWSGLTPIDDLAATTSPATPATCSTAPTSISSAPTRRRPSATSRSASRRRRPDGADDLASASRRRPTTTARATSTSRTIRRALRRGVDYGTSSACARQSAGARSPASVSYSGSTGDLDPDATSRVRLYEVTVASSVDDRTATRSARRPGDVHHPVRSASWTTPSPTSAPARPAPTPTSPTPPAAR